MAGGSSASCSGDGLCRRFDHVVSAVSWKQLGKLLGPGIAQANSPGRGRHWAQLAPITAVHLWFDRPIMDLPHAALVGRLSQWVFQDQAAAADGPALAFHYTVVISASHALVGRDARTCCKRCWATCGPFGRWLVEAKLMHHRVLTQPGAVFSVRPGSEANRPTQQTPIEGLYLAGDWTATDWPATMEGAVRSGYLAIEALLAALGAARAIVVPDLKKGRLMRWIVG